jgi:hypothetical protein
MKEITVKNKQDGSGKGSMLPKPWFFQTKKMYDQKLDLGEKILLGISARQKIFVPDSSSILGILKPINFLWYKKYVHILYVYTCIHTSPSSFLVLKSCQNFNSYVPDQQLLLILCRRKELLPVGITRTDHTFKHFMKTYCCQLI